MPLSPDHAYPPIMHPKSETNMPYLQKLPENATLIDLFRAYPETARPLIAFHEVLLRGESPFSDTERELIAAYVSGLNRCRYCHGVHTATAEALGMPEGAVKDLLKGIDTAPIDERMKPVLRYVEKLTRTPDAMTREDADAVYAAGWDQDALYHAVATCALFNFMNRLVEGLGIELQKAYVPVAAERLSKRGYTELLRMLGNGKS
jgi:uncharacterized peroxidase-related enzyme